VVDHGVTGYLVPLELGTDGTPLNPQRFAADLAAAINLVLQDPAHGRALGLAGRRRVVEQFSWSAVAERTVELYGTLVPASRAG